MKRCKFLIVVAGFLPALVLAQDARSYTCSNADMIRRVEVFSEPGVAVPCEVHYYKDTEAPGERQVLWRAQNQAGYCEAMAGDFVVKLGELGWNCSASDDTAPAETVAEDDTDDLAPAEDIELSEPH